MKVNTIYNEVEIKESGLKPGNGIRSESLVYKKQNKVYLFEKIKNDKLRLHSIINEKSFYL
ncbi:MAG: hypothetical protein KAT05_07480 [Spirochaetes bacterium]|nr:hypothetical protein [Spirochaetota bacterium]